MRIAVFAVFLVCLAGCTGGGTGGGKASSGGTTDGAFDDIGAKATATTGIALGLVVDERIVPIPLADVRLTGVGANKTTKTDQEGRFAFDGLQPGTYFVAAHASLHTDAQSSVEVRAGVESPPPVKLLLQRLYSQDPYHEATKFDGFLQCAWAVEGAASSTCVNDYTHFVGLGYTCPQCEHLFDSRGTTYALGGGWQTQVYEVIWDPSAQGTSPEMRITVSHFPRPASHWYCSGTGPSPILMRIELGVVCDDQQSDPTLQPPEGEINATMFMAAKAPDGQPVAAAVSQKFTVFMTFFYYGKPPEGWSFVNGDAYPF